MELLTFVNRERFTNLDNLNMVEIDYAGKSMVLGLSKFFTTAPDASSKSGQKRLEYNHLALLIYICDTLYRCLWKATKKFLKHGNRKV